MFIIVRICISPVSFQAIVQKTTVLSETRRRDNRDTKICHHKFLMRISVRSPETGQEIVMDIDQVVDVIYETDVDGSTE